jgi:uncharacterized membrane protein
MFIKTYLITLLIFLAIDFLWLGFIAKNFYQQHIGSLMKTNINWIAAFIFYLVFIVGLVILVVNPSLESASWLKALWMGALLGLVAYATYDLTNLATLEGWSLSVTIVDLIWGAVVAGSTSVIAYFVINYFS